MMNDSRSATVRVVSDKMDIAGMSAADFIRIMGSFYGDFKRNFKGYHFEDKMPKDEDMSDIE